MRIELQETRDQFDIPFGELLTDTELDMIHGLICKFVNNKISDAFQKAMFAVDLPTPMRPSIIADSTRTLSHIYQHISHLQRNNQAASGASSTAPVERYEPYEPYESSVGSNATTTYYR